MKTILLLSILILSGINIVFSQSYKELVSAAETAYRSLEFKKSAELYAKAFKIENKSALDLYNAACSEALSGNKSSALKYLEASIDNGWSNLQHFKTDSDLNSLHGTTEWDALVSKLQKNVEKIEANYDKPLQKELLQIFSDDQEIRKLFTETVKAHGYQHPKIDSLGKIMRYRDSTNLIKVKKILDERGWVGSNLVGSMANQTIFLVIQHSDLETQKKYLPMMRDAVRKGNASSSGLALLEDRIAIREGRKQIYGSQIGVIPNTNEHYVLPLEDPDNVDKRRAEVGLGTLSEYVKNWSMTWDAQAYKKRLPEFEKLQKEQEKQ
jgi:hypothetical protein